MHVHPPYADPEELRLLDQSHYLSVGRNVHCVQNTQIIDDPLTIAETAECNLADDEWMDCHAV